MKKESEFWDHKSNKSYPNIIKGLFVIAIFVSLGSFTYAKFSHRADTQPKQAPVQTDDSSTQNKENTTTPSNTQAIQSADNSAPDDATDTKIGSANSGQTQTSSLNSGAKPIDNYGTQITQLNTQKAIDDAKQAEKDAQEQATRQAKIQQCNEYNKQRDAILNPVKQQIYDLQMYYFDIPAIMTERARGRDISQSQLDRMIQSEENVTQSQINQLQLQLNQLLDQYPLCTY